MARTPDSPVVSPPSGVGREGGGRPFGGAAGPAACVLLTASHELLESFVFLKGCLATAGSSDLQNTGVG